MVDKMTAQSLAVGTENLLNVLKNYARVKGDKGNAKQMITVGIVGFPNVGKSSVINSLKRCKATATGNQPGVTKKMQEVHLDKNIVLIDSPGVVLSTNDQTDSLILRQAIKVEELEDPIRPVEALINRIEQEQLVKFYRIAGFKTAEQFLAQVARKKGTLQSGGIPNIEETARHVLRDYMNGKLTYFTTPPVLEDDEDEEEDDNMQQADSNNEDDDDEDMEDSD